MTESVSDTAIADADLQRWFHPLSAHSRVLLAVSGGSDSTALAVLFARWRALANAPVPDAIVVTVDHGLRAAAAAEAAAVAALAGRLGLPHRTLHWQGTKPQAGVQAAARAARYRLLAAFAREAGAGAIVTAHTQDDQAETVLLRLARGSGLAGLGAMHAVRPLGPGLAVRRPLLAATRAQLRAALVAAGTGWSDDPSNDDPAYARVRLRRLMPQLAAEGLTAARLAATARHLQRAHAAIEAMADTLFAQASVARLPEVVALDAGRLAAAHEEVRLRLLARLIATVGGGEYGPRLERLEAACAALLAGSERASADEGSLPAADGPEAATSPAVTCSAVTRPEGAHLAVTRTLGGVTLCRRGGWLWLWREAGREGLERLSLAPGETAVWDRRLSVSLPASATAGVDLAPLGAGTARALGFAPSLGAAGRVPAAALRPLMAVWRQGRVIAVPAFGWQAAGAGRDLPETSCP